MSANRVFPLFTAPDRPDRIWDTFAKEAFFFQQPHMLIPFTNVSQILSGLSSPVDKGKTQLDDYADS